MAIRTLLRSRRLASIFLQEEKGRITRLRKIKSVLASGKLMGNSPAASSSSTQPDRRGKRRPYPNSSQQISHHHHINHRRFQQANDASLDGVQPNYPTNPFGNVDNGTLQFPAPIGKKRTSLEDAVRNGRNEASNNSSRGGRSGTVWDDDTRAIQEVVSVLAGSKEVLYGSRSRSDLRNSGAPSATVNETNPTFSPYREQSSSGANSARGLSRHSPESLNRSRAGAEGSQAISSGPSAIDLFDQCGLVPVAAVEKEGLVGTTDTIQPSRRPPANSTNTDGRDPGPGVADNTLAKYPVAPARVAPRPPLVPGGPSPATNDSRGVRSHPRDAGRHEARAARTKRGQPAATHGVKPRPPFAGGSVSTLSRTKRGQQQQQQQQAPSSSVQDAGSPLPKPSRSVGRGVQNDATQAESPPRCSRGEGPTSMDSHSAAQTESRTRRRWNVGEGTPSAATAAPVPRAPPRSESSAASVSVSGPLSASEQRIASAKERLHKDKDLDALKSEHVEALSILQDISCPSTAAGAGEDAGSSSETATGGNPVGKETNTGPGAEEAARIALLRERRDSSANVTVRSSAAAALGGGVGQQQGPPVGDKFDELSADLPRIGSKEQAALRTMYRKWWMKVANGGSPPSPCTPVDPMESGIPPVAQQHLPIQRGLQGGDEKGTSEFLAVTADAEGSENGLSSFSNVSEARQNGDPPPQKESASAVTVAPPADQGLAAAVAEKEKVNGPSSSACATGDAGRRDEKNVEPPAGKKLAESPEEDRETTGKTPLNQAEADVPTHPEDTQGWGAQAAAAAAAAAVRDTPASEQEQEQQQGVSSDVESVSEDDDLEKEEEEGHHGRIYLPDGRFVATWRNSSEEMADAAAALRDVEKVGGGDGCGEVVDGCEHDQPSADDETLGYADEDFEFED